MGGANSTGGTAMDGGSGAAAGAVRNAFGTVDFSEPYMPFDEPGPDESEDCRLTELKGTLDGEPIEQRYGLGSAWRDGTSWLYAAQLPAWGRAEIFGETSEAVDIERMPLGSSLSASNGRLLLPRFLPHPERLVCARGPNSLTREQNHFEVHLSGVGRLSACEDGVPVEGSLDICMGDTCHALSGTLDGAVIDTDFRVLDANPEYMEGSSEAFWSRAYYRATGPLRAELAEGFIRDEATGAVYCAGAESYAEAEPVAPGAWDGFRRVVHLRGLRRVGDCDDIDAPDSISIRVCTPVPWLR